MTPGREPLQVAIDGPAGSGKSTIASRLAAQLGFIHVDTGAMYRAVALAAHREGIDPANGPALADRLGTADLRFDAEGRLWLDGEDISGPIRGPEVTRIVSQVSAHAGVRAEMVRRQRDLTWDAEPGAVMEGRDIGSVVLPLAAVKVFLTATAQERARRRCAQLGLDPAEAPRIQREIEHRDQLDSTREESPLIVSPDAHVLETTGLSEEEVVQRCVAWVEQAQIVTVAAPRKERLPTGRYRFFHPHVRRFFAFWFGLRISGSGHESVPGGVIYACNHVSNFDPPIVGASLSREVSFLAKSELFWGPFGSLIRCFNAIPIVRGRFDSAAFDRAHEVLSGGGNLLIFPEGTRRPPGHPGPVKKGLGLLAMRSGRPYLPVYLEGTRYLGRCLLRRQRLRVQIGPPVTLHALEHLRETCTDSEIQLRVGQLCLAQFQALAARRR